MSSEEADKAARKRARAIKFDMRRLNEAYQLEQFAIDRYREQQKQTDDPDIHAMLEGIARNEEDHQRMIVECARSLDPDVEVEGRGFNIQEYDPEVPEGTGFARELDFLDYDLFFEDGAQEIYSKHASGAKFPQVKQLFVDLKLAEFGHSTEIEHLLRQIKARKKQVRFFCPVCGFGLSFGKGDQPEAGKVRTCPMCGQKIELYCEDDNWRVRRAE